MIKLKHVSLEDQLLNVKNSLKDGKLLLVYCVQCCRDNIEYYKDEGVCPWCGWGCEKVKGEENEECCRQSN